MVMRGHSIVAVLVNWWVHADGGAWCEEVRSQVRTRLSDDDLNGTIVMNFFCK